VDLGEARSRIGEHSDLNAFISLSAETGTGTVVAVKDLVDVAAMVTTAGGIILPPTPAAEDAPVVKSIRSHGCVVVGKANLHEFAYGVTSVNPHYGPVRNPYDRNRVAGGSSGGSAVAVAMQMCDWAIGSDTGGSIRIPAALCGVVGFKPALGSIDTAGVIPLSRSLDTLGPMAPDVAAGAAAFSMMTGEPFPIEAFRAPRLAVPEGWVADLDQETRRAWELVSSGLPEVPFPGRRELFDVGLTILLVEAAAFHLRWAAECPEKYGADVLALIRRGFDVPAAEYDKAIAALPRLREAAHTAMRDIDALLVPATAITAPLLNAGNEVREQLARFTRPFNTTGQPVVVLPAPTRGLPVGIQVVGKTNDDAIGVATWLEREWRNLAP
jgi:Asp-tRNA(Asn)/Glu-tRNA(Gln) amidotransferase A subunit family amidase